MPCPIDLYHGPASFLMSMPAAFQRLSSAIWVPERSPREMKGAPLALMLCSAKAAFLAPLMLAGSSFGPMMTKSLYITEWRFTPCPSAMNFSSASLACTKSTSAPPRRAMSSAWPVPRATTLTSMPVFCLNSGRMWPNRPESCVEVVEATTMDLSCAEASDICARAKAITNERFRIGEFIEWSTECSQLSVPSAGKQHIRIGAPPPWVNRVEHNVCYVGSSSNCCVHFALVVPILARWVAQVGSNILTNEVYSLPAADFWKPATTQAINIGPPVDTIRISQTIPDPSSQPEP